MPDFTLTRAGYIYLRQKVTFGHTSACSVTLREMETAGYIERNGTDYTVTDAGRDAIRRFQEAERAERARLQAALATLTAPATASPTPITQATKPTHQRAAKPLVETVPGQFVEITERPGLVTIVVHKPEPAPPAAPPAAQPPPTAPSTPEREDCTPPVPRQGENDRVPGAPKLREQVAFDVAQIAFAREARQLGFQVTDEDGKLDRYLVTCLMNKVLRGVSSGRPLATTERLIEARAKLPDYARNLREEGGVRL